MSSTVIVFKIRTILYTQALYINNTHQLSKTQANTSTSFLFYFPVLVKITTLTDRFCTGAIYYVPNIIVGKKIAFCDNKLT